MTTFLWAGLGASAITFIVTFQPYNPRFRPGIPAQTIGLASLFSGVFCFFALIAAGLGL